MRAIVIGAGYAAEGQVGAFRRVGVEVAAVCGREAAVVSRVADRQGVPMASTDWQAVLEDLRPEIVALATPAALRGDVIEAAAERGMHVFCDKPLATTAMEAAALFRVAEAAGIKHAYAATRRYEPSVIWLAELVRSGVVGRVAHVTFNVSACLAPVIPWSWALVLEQGGGLLNNHFVHLLSILERVLVGQVVRAKGRAEFAIERAPVVPGLHDYRQAMALADSFAPEELEAAQWRPCNADTSYSAELVFATPAGEVTVQLTSGAEVESGEMIVRGDQGELRAKGDLEFEVQGHPGPKGSSLEDRYAALAKSFVADIRGDEHEAYLTFRDGWRYQAMVETIRAGEPSSVYRAGA